MPLTISAGAAQIQLHVTSCLALVRAAEDELIRNKVTFCLPQMASTAHACLLCEGPLSYTGHDYSLYGL